MIEKKFKLYATPEFEEYIRNIIEAKGLEHVLNPKFSAHWDLRAIKGRLWRIADTLQKELNIEEERACCYAVDLYVLRKEKQTKKKENKS